MANSVTISWSKGELVSYISNLSAYVAQTLSLSGEVAFNINTLTEDNEHTFLNDKLAEAVNALVPYFSRIIADEAEVQSGENFGITFTPRIEGGSYSKAELSHIKTLCRKIVASYVLTDWYSVKGVAAMNTYFATQSAQSATELNVVLDRFVRPVRKVSVNIGRVTYANKNAANYKHINNRSDFVLEWGTSNGEPLPDGEYDIDFYTDGEVIYSVNSLDTNVVKPIEGVNDKVRIIFDFADGEYFGYGVLKYEMRGDILDADFPDGLRHFELSGDTSIEIWDGASDGEDVYSASYIPSYMKLTFDDLTEEDIEELQRPALEAAEVANEAAEVANEAARRANEAADNAFKNEGTYPKMSVGFAENIVGDGSATPEVFSFRPTAGENRNTLNDGAARIQTLKGSSVVVNQIAKPRVSGSSNGVTWAIAEDGTITLKGTATAQVTFNPFTAPQISGHKYLMIGTPNGGGANKYYMSDQTSAYDYGAGVIYNSTVNSTNWWFVFVIQNGVSVDFIFKQRLIDLTLMFGVGNEPTTVAEFYQRSPVGLDLAAYNEGEIVDGNYEVIKTVGFNQWDEQWELGYFNTSTGRPAISFENIRNVNPIRVLPNTTYYEKQPSASNLLMRVLEYTQDGTYIGFQYVFNQTFTTSPNTAYVNFYMSSVYGTVYNNDICINLSWDEYISMNGTYKPYKPFVRDLSWVAKYFPNGMRSAGNVADEIRFNGSTQKWEAVQRVGVIDLGSLTWYYIDASTTRPYGTFSSAVTGKAGGTYNMTCSKYRTIVAGESATQVDKVVRGNEGTNIYIADASYTGTPTANFKAAMQGVMLNYELATPIIAEIEENVNFDFDVSDYGTEELISDGASAPLSADIVYEPNVLATIKNLPNILARLTQMEAMVSAMAVATTNTNE